MPRKKSLPSQELILSKIEEAGLSSKALATDLRIVHEEGRTEGLLKRGRARTKQLESSVTQIVRAVEKQRAAVLAALNANSNALPVRAAMARFDAIAKAIDRFRESIADLQVGDTAATLFEAGGELNTRTLGTLVLDVRWRAKLTYQEIAVLLVDGWPKRRVLSPSYSRKAGETREATIARVTDTLRRCAHDARDVSKPKRRRPTSRD